MADSIGTSGRNSTEYEWKTKQQKKKRQTSRAEKKFETKYCRGKGRKDKGEEEEETKICRLESNSVHVSYNDPNPTSR